MRVNIDDRAQDPCTWGDRRPPIMTIHLDRLSPTAELYANNAHIAVFVSVLSSLFTKLYLNCFRRTHRAVSITFTNSLAG